MDVLIFYVVDISRNRYFTFINIENDINDETLFFSFYSTKQFLKNEQKRGKNEKTTATFGNHPKISNDIDFLLKRRESIFLLP